MKDAVKDRLEDDDVAVAGSLGKLLLLLHVLLSVVDVLIVLLRHPACGRTSLIHSNTWIPFIHRYKPFFSLCLGRLRPHGRSRQREGAAAAAKWGQTSALGNGSESLYEGLKSLPGTCSQIRRFLTPSAAAGPKARRKSFKPSDVYLVM